MASQRRLAALQAALRDRGVSEEQVRRLKRPKGLIGTALRPGEIAFSVMAELLEARHQHIRFGVEAPAVQRAEAIDPICGMTVHIATARYTSERDGQTYYFCCAGCKRSFESS